ncbi:hypothetical protein NC652_035126 [Populus alba x Populus x berolinensis]|nr:hypothetical protein NC652_035126 [Populus alba x Populus x berolinensis]
MHAVHHCKFHETSLVSSSSLQPLPSYPLVVDYPWIRILMFTPLPHLMVSSFTSPPSTLSLDYRTPCTTPSSVPCLPLHLVPLLQLQQSLIIYPSPGLNIFTDTSSAISSSPSNHPPPIHTYPMTFFSCQLKHYHVLPTSFLSQGCFTLFIRNYLFH